MADKRRKCPVKAYAEAVVNGDILACKYVIQACQRHLDDLISGAMRGLTFDRDKAEKAIDFIQILRHSKGEWGGKPFLLSDWQKFIVGCVFGWYRADGTRRYRTAYVQVPRKNGKSTLMAGICLYALLVDGEMGAEVYTAATKRDQARIVFDEAVNMIRQWPAHYAMRKRIDLWRNQISVPYTASKMMPLSAQANSLDGLNPHLCAIDELHAHQSRDVFDVLKTATGARRQPLLFAITTAGWNRNGVCYQQFEYAGKVLGDIIADDSYFAYIATIDDGDDWTKESSWRKANPNYGISAKREQFETLCRQAKEMPGEQNKFLQLHLDVWTEQASRWLDMDVWDEANEPYDDDILLNRPCFGGLDMASTEDLSAFGLVFPPCDHDPYWRIKLRLWLPGENLTARVRNSNVPYDVWVQQGYIELTEGNIVDYAVVEERIKEDYERYDVKEIAFDRWNTTQMVTNLMNEGLEMVQFGQGFASMSAPSKTLSENILNRTFMHGGHPVLRWMASNVAVRTDPAGNLKPDKEKSSQKIDGIVALIMGIGRANVSGEEQKNVYEERGIRSL